MWSHELALRVRLHAISIVEFLYFPTIKMQFQLNWKNIKNSCACKESVILTMNIWNAAVTIFCSKQKVSFHKNINLCSHAVRKINYVPDFSKLTLSFNELRYKQQIRHCILWLIPALSIIISEISSNSI